LGEGKGRPSGDLAGLPSGLASFLLRAAILFAVARKSPYGALISYPGYARDKRAKG